MSDKELLLAIKKSIDNQMAYTDFKDRKAIVIYSIKQVLWILCLCLFSKYERYTQQIIYFVCTTNQEKMMNKKGYHKLVCLGKSNCKLSALKKKHSYFICYKFHERIGILIKAIKYVCKYRRQIKIISAGMEYFLLNDFIKRNNPIKICMAGHFDRYTTILSYISYYSGYQYELYQHGIIASVQVPQKIYCTRFHVFDEIEMQKVKAFILNMDCIFEFDKFIPTFEWSIFSKKQNKKIICFASQDKHTKISIILIRELLKIIKNTDCILIIYPHYAEKKNAYREFRKNSQTVVEKEKRYKNVDCLITFYSSLAYDYFSINDSIPVFCYKICGYDASYYLKSNVCVINNMNTLCKRVESFINE